MNAPDQIRAFWERRAQKDREYWQKKHEKGAPG
jgi:hypothetical protein